MGDTRRRTKDEVNRKTSKLTNEIDKTGEKEGAEKKSVRMASLLAVWVHLPFLLLPLASLQALHRFGGPAQPLDWKNATL